MRKTLALALFVASGAIGADYAIAPDGSYVRLEVDKTGRLRGKTHVFTFSRFQGNVSYFESSVANSKVSFTIEAQSIQCKDPWLSSTDLATVEQYAERDMLAVDRYGIYPFDTIPW